MLLCSLVIVYSLKHKRDHKEQMLDSASSDLGGLRSDASQERVLGKFWQALVCHCVPWSSCIYLKPNNLNTIRKKV